MHQNSEFQGICILYCTISQFYYSTNDRNPILSARPSWLRGGVGYGVDVRHWGGCPKNFHSAMVWVHLILLLWSEENRFLPCSRIEKCFSHIIGLSLCVLKFLILVSSQFKSWVKWTRSFIIIIGLRKILIDTVLKKKNRRIKR